MIHVLIFVGVCVLGFAAGGVGFFIGIFAWIAYSQAEADVKRDEQKYKDKWYGEYK